MKVLLLHNRYLQPGGEDTVVEAEKCLLRSASHHVAEYTRNNGELAGYGLWRKATLPPRTVWAWDGYREIKALIENEIPDVAHFHNTFPLISPAAYYACHEAGVPVVQTLHNYRLVCPGATLMRNGRVCEDCLGKTFPWPGIAHGCYRDSGPASATVAMMLGVHNSMSTWARKVDVFIALTEFARRKFIEGGLPADKIVVKPNFVHPDPPGWEGESGVGRPESREKGYAMFVGRLSSEKGLRTLVRAWKRLRGNIPLRIVGDGPLRSELEASVNGSGLVSFHGRKPREQVVEALRGARFLVFPSEWYETFGLTVVEAFACGVPVIASRLGVMEEIVEDGKTGLHFTAGDANDLADKVEWAWTHPAEMDAMGCAARAEHEAKYTAERNYEILVRIYARATARTPETYA